MGERHFEPAATRPERAATKAAPRIHSCRSAKAMRKNLVALTFCCLPGLAAADEVELVGAWNLETQSIVGVSGLEVSEDGMSFVAVGDQGWWLTGRFLRQNGAISEVFLDEIQPIIGQDGYPVSARRVGDWSDAEGLAIAPDGRAWVSFERWIRVASFDAVMTKSNWIKDHPSFYDYSENWQLEAVAVDPNGQVFAFPEKPQIEGFPIYRLAPEGWVIDGHLPEHDVFSIVGADFDENGDLYLLERKLIVGLWWQSRIRRIRLDGSEDTAIWTSERGEFGNLEGISLWRDEDGLRLVLVSDNNANEDTPTEFVEFRLTED